MNTKRIRTELNNGTIIYVEATVLDPEQDVAFGIPSFKGVMEAVEGIAQSLTSTLEKVKPRKATVEFGVEIGVEAGELTALLVKGSGTADLKITLEWGTDQ